MQVGEFEKQWIEMLNFYFDTEKQFTEISRIIPLDNSDETYSPVCIIFYKVHVDK